MVLHPYACKTQQLNSYSFLLQGQVIKNELRRSNTVCKNNVNYYQYFISKGNSNPSGFLADYRNRNSISPVKFSPIVTHCIVRSFKQSFSYSRELLSIKTKLCYYISGVIQEAVGESSAEVNQLCMYKMTIGIEKLLLLFSRIQHFIQSPHIRWFPGFILTLARSPK